MLVVATARAGYIFYQRHQDRLAAERQKQALAIGYSNPDYYVNPKKLYPYDLKSAKQLTQQPVWVKEGYRYMYYPYDPATKRVDFKHETGLLGPIERVAVTDVVMAPNPVAGQPKQVVALFEKDGKTVGVPIGYESGDEYKIYSDEMFYVQDPRDLYKHWSADIWQSVFAIGMGVPDAGDVSYEKTVRYPNGGKPLVIVYHDGKAAEIKPGTPAS
jgi:hypothetical protein